MSLYFRSRKLAIIDLETSELNPETQEILEAGMITAEQPDLNIVKAYEAKVKPLHVENADTKALELNG